MTESSFRPKGVILIFPQPSPRAVAWSPAATFAANSLRLTDAEREICAGRARARVGSRQEDVRVILSDVTHVTSQRESCPQSAIANRQSAIPQGGAK